MPTNRQIAELLSDEADPAEDHIRRAFQRAARCAFTWPDEAVPLDELLAWTAQLREQAAA